MSDDIPFRRDFEFEYGVIEQITPMIRRIVARNASAFTFHGTGTYIVGHGSVAVIDPGPDLEEHIDALLTALSDEEISHLLVTHTHRDHSPGCRLVQKERYVDAFGYGPHGAGKIEQGVPVEEGGDMEFMPDIVIGDGEVIEGDGWTIEAVYTPGHTSNHLCYALKEEGVLFSGDHVMGWSTSIVSPPDGDMADYMASLALLLDREDSVYWPTHGPSIENPRRHVRAFITHRKMREAQIVECVRDGIHKIPAMVAKMYRNVPEDLHRAATRSVFAHAIHMVETGRLITEGELAVDATYQLA